MAKLLDEAVDIVGIRARRQVTHEQIANGLLTCGHRDRRETRTAAALPPRKFPDFLSKLLNITKSKYFTIYSDIVKLPKYCQTFTHMTIYSNNLL